MRMANWIASRCRSLLPAYRVASGLFVFLWTLSLLMFVRARNETDVLPTAANELEVSVLLHSPLSRLQVPEAHLVFEM